MPLGGTFGGWCRVPNKVEFTPPEERLRCFCNTGYGEGRCDRFPSEAEADVVRFVIKEDRGVRGRLQYTFEKDHHPAGKGELELPAEGSVLAAQANAYWNSYLERKWK